MTIKIAVIEDDFKLCAKILKALESLDCEVELVKPTDIHDLLISEQQSIQKQMNAQHEFLPFHLRNKNKHKRNY